jgi:hypothetical protein
LILKEIVAGEPVSRIDPPGIENTQVTDFAQQKFVIDVSFGSEVRISATTLPQFFDRSVWDSSPLKSGDAYCSFAYSALACFRMGMSGQRLSRCCMRWDTLRISCETLRNPSAG